MNMIDFRTNPEEHSDISSFELIDSAPVNPKMNGSGCHGTSYFRMNTLLKAFLQVWIYLAAYPNNTILQVRAESILFIYSFTFQILEWHSNT